jgi:hypothetical protein
LKIYRAFLGSEKQRGGISMARRNPIKGQISKVEKGSREFSVSAIVVVDADGAEHRIEFPSAYGVAYIAEGDHAEVNFRDKYTSRVEITRSGLISNPIYASDLPAKYITQ